ncbi:hypothetical protein ACFPAF_06975 [Hymenobacter endophyticus]|uniref:Uncharacterized protein n=1 Tax=Hymenobacter endophyticus TaxID=3076335 RepID=A0ABU3TFJ1_9BACT|nr:hypothetical protein [Hymenobacter endophyticus]MDU0370128.1 hypothetical protein [Hymenobacter endophyticus]
MSRILLLFPLLLAACSSPYDSAHSYPQNPAVSNTEGHPRDSTTFYFPAADSLHPAYLPKSKRPSVVWNTDVRFANCADDLKGASYTLTYFDAPVLSNYYLGTDIIRFLWERSFHRPVLLTLHYSSEGSTLRTQLLDKYPGFHTLTVFHPDSLASTASAQERVRAWKHYNETMADPVFQRNVAEGKRRAAQVKAEETTVPVTPEQWQHLQELLAQTEFPKMCPCQPCPGLLDGASWLLETHTASGYHQVARRSPEEQDGFRRACEYLIDLSSVRDEERY